MVEDWDRVMGVNAKGVFLGTKAAIPELRRAGGGSIINISSVYGLVGSSGGASAYHASKGAVRLLTKSTAIQYAGEGAFHNLTHHGDHLRFRQIDPIEDLVKSHLDFHALVFVAM